MDRNEFEQDRTIDPLQLDIEAARQADLFSKWAERAVDAKTKVERAKLQLQVVEASLQLQCRESPEKFGLAKVTDSAVNAAVHTHRSYIDAQEAYLHAKEQADLFSAAVDAMEQKKRMIESLITLHGQQYFAGPSVPRDLMSAWREYQEGVDERVNRKQADRAKKRKRKRRKADG